MEGPAEGQRARMGDFGVRIGVANPIKSNHFYWVGYWGVLGWVLIGFEPNTPNTRISIGFNLDISNQIKPLQKIVYQIKSSPSKNKCLILI